MLKAANVLGIIAGVLGIAVGFFGYSLAEVMSLFDTVEGNLDGTGAPDEGDSTLITKIISIASPILAIVGGAMAAERAGAGAVFLALSAAGMFYGFGFNVFTMFPITMAGLASLLALPAALSGPRAER